ncbi:hypothetical protein [Stenotrophomonas maltophilia]|uniref:hypothetical protein n=2 Tax=Stenotrophomonas TaxID=40323 RepID=UPI001F1D4C92|nr:hypothetical protein [Stenotrophomonas maltophilia]
MSEPMKASGSASGMDIPKHWNVTKFWTVARQVSRSGLPDAGLMSVYLDRGVIPYSEGGGLVHKPSESLDAYQLVEPGNFVLNNQQAWRGSVGVSKHRGIVSPAYLIFELSKELDPTFANYQFRETRFVDEMMLSSQGVGDIQRQVKWPLLRLAKVFLPPITEQREIASHLERATTRIDALVAKKTRFIGLLREKRQAMITHAVTKGLDRSVAMKASGSASGLDLPKHWNVSNFWTVSRQISRTSHQNVGLMSVYLDRGVIPYSEGGGLVHKPSESLDAYQLVEPGNFVLNNQQAWRGSVGVSKHRGIVSPAYLVFELSKDLNPDFANYQFREKRFVDEMMLSSQGVGDIQRQVKWPLLRLAKVFLPPIDEQREIVAHLDRATTRIDTLIAKTERSIDLLREHRTALITAAVTGKIDLRPAA